MFKEIKPTDISTNVFDDIGNKWMLVTAKKPDGSVNTMTASWGTMGVLWGKNVFICFIRPQRHTHNFTEESDRITLSFFSEEYREALKYCGRTSGRDEDKIKKCKLTLTEGCGFEEATRNIYGRKLYAGVIDPKFFKDESIEKNYNGDYHTVYICEIEKIEEKEL